MLYHIYMIGIYMILNTINGKIYIGKSINIERRWKEELNGQLNAHIRRSMDKYGIANFKFSVILECEAEELDEKEKFYIDFYNSHHRDFGYNKTLGGEGGQWSEQTKKKVSKMRMGEGNPFYGKRHSEKTKAKISEGRTGEKHWHYGGTNSLHTRKLQSETKQGALNPMAKTVFQYDLQGVLINSFPCVMDASKATGIGYSAIKNCANNESKTAGGYSWEYGEFVQRKFKHKYSKNVLCIETGEIFSSLTEAAKNKNMTASQIKKVCDGDAKHTRGLHFSYID